MAILQSIPIGCLVLSTTNPRDEPGPIAELAESIKEDGLIQPLVVRMTGSVYEILCGSRRYAACKHLRMDNIPCLVETDPGMRVMDIQLAENVQRRDLNGLEIAKALQTLVRIHGSNDAAARRCHKSASWVIGHLLLLDLVPSGKKLLLDGRLSKANAAAIAKLPAKEQNELIAKLLAGEVPAHELADRSRVAREQGGEPRAARRRASGEVMPTEVTRMYKVLQGWRKLNAAQLACLKNCVDAVYGKVDSAA